MMLRTNRFLHASSVLAIGFGCLAGCQHFNHCCDRSALSLRGEEHGPEITRRQKADVEVALGRSLEQKGQVGQAIAAYQEAVKRDPHRVDAMLRLAILNDQRGKIEEAAGWYRKALKAEPGNPDVYCDRGYSLYLQRRWADAEMSLRQAIALDSDHTRAHNNLGLVLAHTERLDEALAAFRQAGCDDADAHTNLAFCLAVDRQWDDACKQYEAALAADPASQPAREGLRELRLVAAKAAPIRETTAASGDAIALTATAIPAPVESHSTVALGFPVPGQSERQAARDLPGNSPEIVERHAATGVE